MLYFGAFLSHFYSASTIQVPLQQQQVPTTVTTVVIFELLLLGHSAQSHNVICHISNAHASDWLKKCEITVPATYLSWTSVAFLDVF